jgi:hypothetical protein
LFRADGSRHRCVRQTEPPGVLRLWLGIATAMIYVAMPARAQELEPRAYSISPRGMNFIVLALVRSSGDISFDSSLPIEDATDTVHAAAFAYTRAIGFAGRSASVSLVVPYIWGSVQGLVSGSFEQAHRSGLADPAFRFAINFYGAPAMNAEQFRDYHQKTNVGASIVVLAPLGQYDPARLLNIGSNRWAMRPEIGVSKRAGPWYFDLYLGAWLYTDNRSFRGGVRRQEPMGAAQVHVSCTMTPRIWAAFDAGLLGGGRTSVGGLDHADYRRESRLGGTLSILVTRHQSIKFYGSATAATGIGASYLSIGMGYQYRWGGGL